MPRLKSAIKRVRTSERNRKHNLHYKSAIKSILKKVADLVAKKDLESALKARNEAFKLIDMATCKKIVKKNYASRRKSRIAKWLKTIEPKNTGKAKSKS